MSLLSVASAPIAGGVTTAMHALDRQSLHEVAYAVLLRAPSLEQLDAQTHRLRAALGSRL